MYLITCTRPDLAYPLSILARDVAPGRHRPEHMAAAKRVLRYLCSTSGLGLVLGGRRPVVLTGHADASWADDQATQRSSQGYTFSLGSGSVSWRSTCSSFVLGSSCEAEIYAGAMAAQELRWLTYLLADLGELPRSPPVLYVDNKAMLALCREHKLEHRTKHIALRYFLARELQQRGQLRLAYVASEAITADIFTEALAPGDHQRFCTMLACFPLLDWSCDLLFSPTLPMGLEVAGLKGFADDTVPIPPVDNVGLRGEFRAAHLLTFMVISRCCSPVVQLALRSCREHLDAGHQAWHFLLSTYQVRDDLYIAKLEEKMTHIRMGEQESATDYCNRARRILAEMRMAGAEYSTASYISHIVKGLPRGYNLMKRMMMVPGTRESLNEDSITSYILQDEAMQEAEQPTELLPQANYAAPTKLNQQQGQRRMHGGGGSGGGRSTKDVDEKRSTRGKGRGGDGRRRECWICHDPDHLSYECPDRGDIDEDDTKGGRGRCKSRGDADASCSMVSLVEPTVSLAPEAGEDFQAVAAAVQANPMALLLDSGCSHHLMGAKAVFVDMAPSGSVKHANLLYAGQLKESGVQLKGDGDEMLLVAAIGKVLSQARYTGRVLCTDLRPCPMQSHVDTIKSSAKHDVATGLDITPSTGTDPPCISYVGGKLAQHTFPATGSDAAEALAVVHIDLCGPFRVAAKDGSLYFLLLKDRHTRFVWVMPTARKSNVLRDFKKWLVLVERQTKKSVLMLFSDRGGEFLRKEFTEFVDGKGIVHDLTCPYTPQQNSMVEREMRTTVESVRTMLLHMGVQHHWWHLALRQAVWVRNCLERSTTPPGTTPYQLLTGKKPDLSLARVWGCMVQFMVPEQQRGGKLAPKAQWGLHLGVSLESKGWEILDLTDNKVVTSVEVIFYETLSLEVWKAKFGTALGRTQAHPPTDTSTATIPLLVEVDEPADEDVVEVLPPSSVLAPPFPVTDRPASTPVSTTGNEGSLEASAVAPASGIAGGQQGAKPVDQDGNRSTTGEQQTGEPIEQEASAGVHSTGELSKSAGGEQLVESSKQLVNDLDVDEEGELSAGKESTDSDMVEVSIMKPEPRRTGRARRPLERLSFHACLPPAAFTTERNEVDDDLLYDDAKEDEELPELDPDAAMEEEIRSLVGMGTWELVECPRGVNIMRNRWVLTTKYRLDDAVEREKARLVVKGFTQVCGADYDETYSLVSSYVTLRIFLGIAAVLDLNLMQLDIKNAFLQSKLDRVLYMHQPDYFDDGTGRVCKLLKSLYGLKQSPLLWYRALDGVLLGAGWKKSQVDEALYFKAGDDGVTCWVLVYVDDLLVASSSPAMLKELKELLEAAFELREIFPVVKYLGLEIVRDRPARKLWLHEQGYTDKLCRRFIDGEQGGRLSKTPVSVDAYAEPTFDDEEEYRQKVGSLQFAATTTRPDIAFACSKLGSGLTFGGGPESLELVSYVDADDAGDKQDRTSTGGYVFIYGGAAVSWSSSHIKCTTLSSTESEYVAATNAGKEGRRLHFLLAEFKLLDAGKPTILRVNNKSAITVAEGLGLTGNLKHMERRYAWLQHMVRRGKFVLKYIPTTEQPADFLTKALHFPAFNRCSVVISQGAPVRKRRVRTSKSASATDGAADDAAVPRGGDSVIPRGSESVNALESSVGQESVTRVIGRRGRRAASNETAGSEDLGAGTAAASGSGKRTRGRPRKKSEGGTAEAEKPPSNLKAGAEGNAGGGDSAGAALGLVTGSGSGLGSGSGSGTVEKSGSRLVEGRVAADAEGPPKFLESSKTTEAAVIEEKAVAAAEGAPKSFESAKKSEATVIEGKAVADAEGPSPVIAAPSPAVAGPSPAVAGREFQGLRSAYAKRVGYSADATRRERGEGGAAGGMRGAAAGGGNRGRQCADVAAGGRAERAADGLQARGKGGRGKGRAGGGGRGEKSGGPGGGKGGGGGGAVGGAGGEKLAQNRTAYLQVLGTGMDTGDTSPCVLLFFERLRLVFNAGEGLQRLCIEHRIRLSKVGRGFKVLG
ncbi:unnamed protein product [Closterium sp. NIES-53]